MKTRGPLRMIQLLWMMSTDYLEIWDRSVYCHSAASASPWEPKLQHTKKYKLFWESLKLNIVMLQVFIQNSNTLIQSTQEGLSNSVMSDNRPSHGAVWQQTKYKHSYIYTDLRNLLQCCNTSHTCAVIHPFSALSIVWFLCPLGFSSFPPWSFVSKLSRPAERI